MIEISNLRIPLSRLDGTEQRELAVCRRAAAKKLGIKEGRIRTVELRRRSVDARKRNAIQIIFTVRVGVQGNEAQIAQGARNNVWLVAEKPYALPARIEHYQGPRPVVVGAGCAGLFCALALAEQSAIPYGKQLTEAEMRDMLMKLVALPSYRRTADGKVIVSLLTDEEINKRF